MAKTQSEIQEPRRRAMDDDKQQWRRSQRPEGGIIPAEVDERIAEQDKQLIRDESAPIDERREAFRRHNRRQREANQ